MLIAFSTRNPEREYPVKKKPINTLRIAIHLFGLFPLLQIGFYTLTDNLTFNPIQFLTQQLGFHALNLLIASLAVTPIVTLTGWRQLIKHRRTVGLYAAFYAGMHFIMFAGIDYALDLNEINRQIVEKPYILMGFTAGLILLALTLTSTKASMKRMGKSWQSLHRGVYLVGIIVIIHYAWALKGNITSLSGDVLDPLLKGLLVTLLLVLRIPAVRKWAAGLRQRIKLPRALPARS